MGTTIEELIEDHGGGMQEGYALRDMPGGASTDF